MNERKTSSMLQRVPVILAVTAASYGLQLPAGVARTDRLVSSSAPAGQDGRPALPQAGSTHQAAASQA